MKDAIESESEKQRGLDSASSLSYKDGNYDDDHNNNKNKSDNNNNNNYRPYHNHGNNNIINSYSISLCTFAT